MLIIWQCCNIHKISASQLRNSHNTTMGQIFLCTYLNIYAGVPVATGDSTFCAEQDTNPWMKFQDYCQCKIQLSARFYSPSTFPRSRKCCGRNCTLCTLKEFENILKKKLQLLSYCKGQQIPKPLMWWVKKERHPQKAVELPQAWTVFWRRLALSFVSKKSPCWNIHGAYRRLGFI